MATKNAILRLILSFAPDTDEEPSCELDTAQLPVAFPILTGFKVKRIEDIALAAGAADQPLLFTDAIGVIIVSDSAFNLRLAAGETLVENTRLFVVWADDNDDGVLTTSVLLTGNAVSEALLTAYIIEKP